MTTPWPLTTIDAYRETLEDLIRQGKRDDARALLGAIKRRAHTRSCGDTADWEYWRRIWNAVAAYQEACG